MKPTARNKPKSKTSTVKTVANSGVKRKRKSTEIVVSDVHSRGHIKAKRSAKPMNRLSADFFNNKSCVDLAKALLGQILCRRLSPNGQTLKATIVETEAYLGAEDKASATYNGRRTEHLEPLYMTRGTCFVYMTYGMYHCMNLSADGNGNAVLLRAVQPIDGLDQMQSLRAKCRKTGTDTPYKQTLLANGPSKLCMAMDIDRHNINKVNITDSELIWLETGSTVSDDDIVCTKRIGIDRAKEWANKPLRFYIKDNEYISKK
ncbi:uncharacterized protein LOC128954018 [Oppia nitens]|uniref:uncharacterized protein LOC128954018 n=1 Tax=Oppia nitens TaxID=1686743 RepID=UPI0023DA4B1B|nr:uncharacterized protein LOC128954018 [Oppia nitens]